MSDRLRITPGDVARALTAGRALTLHVTDSKGQPVAHTTLEVPSAFRLVVHTEAHDGDAPGAGERTARALVERARRAGHTVRLELRS